MQRLSEYERRYEKASSTKATVVHRSYQVEGSRLIATLSTASTKSPAGAMLVTPTGKIVTR